MDNYVMLNDMLQNHADRMVYLKRYYPFFRLMETGFSQFKEGKYQALDMGYLVMALLRFLIEYNHFQDVPVVYEDYRQFLTLCLKRDFGMEEEEAGDEELIWYIFDKINNEGRPFSYSWYDPVTHEKKVGHVRLIENELAGDQVRYRISGDAVAFYLDTKEVGDESAINVAQLLLSKMIKTRNFRGGMDVVSRINMEVGRLLEEAAGIQTLLGRSVQEGLEALDAYHTKLQTWFDEEQKMFETNIALTAGAIEKLEANHITGREADAIYELDTALKNATRRHGQLMHLYLQMQKAGDEALARAKRTRFRQSVDFTDIKERIMDADDASLLEMLIQPLFAPKLERTLNLGRVDDLLTYRREAEDGGELIEEKPVEMYVYEDELEQQRMDENFGMLLKVLFDQLMKKDVVSLDYLNYLYTMKFSQELLANADYYAFLVHLSMKDYYDLAQISEHQDTFLEGTMAGAIKDMDPEYKNLQFSLVFMPEETITIQEKYTFNNIRFERMR